MTKCCGTNVSLFTRACNIGCEHKKMFLFFQSIFCPQKYFPVCASWKQNKYFLSRSFAHPKNTMSNNVSATVCPRSCHRLKNNAPSDKGLTLELVNSSSWLRRFVHLNKLSVCLQRQCPYYYLTLLRSDQTMTSPYNIDTLPRAHVVGL